MTYQRPDSIWGEVDEAVRAAEHDLGKVRHTLSEAFDLTRRGKTKSLPEKLAAAIKRVDQIQGALHPRGLTQYRQRVAEPKEARRQQSTGPPDDLVCKKCGQDRERNDFFWDDGHGGYGFTMRCVQCRPAARKGKSPAETGLPQLPGNDLPVTREAKPID